MNIRVIPAFISTFSYVISWTNQHSSAAVYVYISEGFLMSFETRKYVKDFSAFIPLILGSEVSYVTVIIP